MEEAQLEHSAPAVGGGFSLLKTVERKLLRAEIEAEFAKRDKVSSGRATAIPKLSTRTALKYIAAVARAVQLRHLEPKQAGAMLYAAQLLIAAAKLNPPPAAPAARPQLPKRAILEGRSDC